MLRLRAVSTFCCTASLNLAWTSRAVAGAMRVNDLLWLDSLEPIHNPRQHGLRQKKLRANLGRASGVRVQKNRRRAAPCLSCQQAVLRGPARSFPWPGATCATTQASTSKPGLRSNTAQQKAQTLAQAKHKAENTSRRNARRQ